VKVRTAIEGLVDVKMAQDQPYATKTVFEVELNPDETFVMVQVEGVAGRAASLAQQSFNLRECEGKVVVFTEPEKPEVTVPVPEAPAFPSTTPMIPQGSMFETTYDNIDFGISYLMEEGSITEMKVDEDAKSVTLNLENVREGEFLISLPSGLITAPDDNFVILLPGLPPLQYEVVESSSEYTTLKIDMPEGTSEVTIVGTNVVPEFGIMAIAILVVSILGIVVVTRKHRLGFEKF